MDEAGLTFASLMSLGPDLAVSTAETAAELGYRSFWTAETTGPEAFSLLGAVSILTGGASLAEAQSKLDEVLARGTLIAHGFYAAEEFEKLSTGQAAETIALTAPLSETSAATA